jgi:hypothetical protein
MRYNKWLEEPNWYAASQNEKTLCRRQFFPISPSLSLSLSLSLLQQADGDETVFPYEIKLDSDPAQSWNSPFETSLIDGGWFLGKVGLAEVWQRTKVTAAAI